MLVHFPWMTWRHTGWSSVGHRWMIGRWPIECILIIWSYKGMERHQPIISQRLTNWLHASSQPKCLSVANWRSADVFLFPFEMNSVCRWWPNVLVTGTTYNVELKLIWCRLDVSNWLGAWLVNVRLLSESGHLLIVESLPDLCDCGISVLQ